VSPRQAERAGIEAGSDDEHPPCGIGRNGGSEQIVNEAMAGDVTRRGAPEPQERLKLSPNGVVQKPFREVVATDRRRGCRVIGPQGAAVEGRSGDGLHVSKGMMGSNVTEA
jgi:hypothetical protein